MTMFRRTMESVRQLPGRDAWSLEPSLDSSGYGCTRLLTQFVSAVTDVVGQAEEQVLTGGPQESALMENETVRKDVVVLVYNLVATFAQVGGWVAAGGEGRERLLDRAWGWGGGVKGAAGRWSRNRIEERVLWGFVDPRSKE